jgi:hypothetical protein
MQSKQTRTTKKNTPIKRGFKREQGLVLGMQMQETLKTELSLKRHLLRDLDYNTQRLYTSYIFID